MAKTYIHAENHDVTTAYEVALQTPAIREISLKNILKENMIT